MSADLIPGLSALASWLLGEVLRHYAAREGWTAAEKRRIPRVAVLLGAAIGRDLGAVIQGGGWREVGLGALGGAAAIAVRETTRRPKS